MPRHAAGRVSILKPSPASLLRSRISYDTHASDKLSSNLRISCFSVCIIDKLCSSNMCEKRIRKIKKGSQLARLREARRLQRMQWLASPTTPEALAPPPPQSAVVDKAAQNRVILELAWKTIALMQKNRLIQQKIIALQKETSDFVAAVMSNPENKRRYLEHVRLYAAGLITLQPAEDAQTKPLKIESKN
ncbi:uncharacterized protein LOC123663902 [Melitaea cinxia]|uniref:uncharacterized protein LOC123663902 n=1 Tax=Melitaea cinxia TaxID=113334 RepID=UPI001E26F93B|nr:uncharacterized protein LOC123663902 [Melitaea cinxia]